MVDVEYREAIVEVLEILKHTDKEIIEKIPKDLLKMWEENKSKTYKPQLDYTKSLNEMNLKPKARALIAMIYREFICTNEEKKELYKKIREKEYIIEKQKETVYNADKLFENIEKKKEENKIEEDINLIKKENIFEKIKNIIKKIFARK